MTYPIGLAEALSSAYADACLLTMTQHPDRWEVSARRELPSPAPDASGKTYLYAVGSSASPHLASAIAAACTACLEDYDLLTFTPTFAGPTDLPTTPAPNLLALLNLPATPAVHVTGTIRRS